MLASLIQPKENCHKTGLDWLSSKQRRVRCQQMP